MLATPLAFATLGDCIAKFTSKAMFWHDPQCANRSEAEGFVILGSMLHCPFTIWIGPRIAIWGDADGEKALGSMTETFTCRFGPTGTLSYPNVQTSYAFTFPPATNCFTWPTYLKLLLRVPSGVYAVNGPPELLPTLTVIASPLQLEAGLWAIWLASQ